MGASDDTISLRELMELKFAALEREVSALRAAMEQVCINVAVFERTQSDVRALGTKYDKLDDRVTANEFKLRVVSWVGGALSSIMIALSIALLSKVFGL